MGRGTRSELRTAIKKGRVTVDGAVVKDPGAKVTEASSVSIDGEAVGYASLVYIMLNKPAGVITATEDSRERTVMDLLEGNAPEGIGMQDPAAGTPGGASRAARTFLRRGLAPVGRLDKDTEGLLLITNDGACAHRLHSPNHHVDKVYYAELDGPVGEREIALFAAGLEIRDDEPFTALPAELKVIDGELPAEPEAAAGGPETGPEIPDGGQVTWPEIPDGGWNDLQTPAAHARVLVTIREGKYHQVKRMFAAVGRRVLCLKRLSMGPLRLDESLEPGQWRLLTEEEIERLG